MEADERKSKLEQLRKDLSGTTLLVYMYILHKRAVGVRETQRALSLSSPSVASYHLDKLVNNDLIEKNPTGTYHLRQKADIPSLAQYVFIGKWVVPRYLFYAVFTTIFYFGFLAFFYNGELTSANVFAVLIGAFSCLIFWIETVKALMDRPWL
ncbi:MAG: winged helix-turn-helix domain-containing protein [Candidatus Hodarchaeota archaeon]